jgi:hypothetical protein
LRSLQGLCGFKDSIQAGYLLLFGGTLGGDSQEPGGVSELLEMPDIRTELDRAVRFGLARRPDSSGQVCSIFHAELDSAMTIGFHLPRVVAGTQSPHYVMGENLPPVTAEELRTITGRDPYESIRNMYTVEVGRTIRAAATASSVGAAALFDRRVDEAILAAAQHVSRATVQAASVGSVKLALPYVQGIPRERLLDLRADIPECFRDFRSTVSDIVLSAMKAEPSDGITLAQLRLEREVGKSTSELQREIEAVSAKTRLLGYGAIVPSLAMLVGSMIGAGTLETMMVASTASTGAAITAASQSVEGRSRAKANPFYFIWKASRK